MIRPQFFRRATPYMQDFSPPPDSWNAAEQAV